MAAFRTYLDDFALSNPLYAGATVTVYTIDPVTLTRTSQLAPLYNALVGNVQLGNPQSLDSSGAWVNQPYVDQPVIISIGNALVPDHETGIAGPLGSFKGDWAQATVYMQGDTVRDGPAANGTSSIYISTEPQTSGNSFAADLAAGNWALYIDVSAIGGNVLAQATAAAITAGTTAGQTAVADLIPNPASGTTGQVLGISTGTYALEPNPAIAANAYTDATAVTLQAQIAAVSNPVTTAIGLLPYSFKNALINGRFDVQQRGRGPFSTSGVTADGWRIGISVDAFAATVVALSDGDRANLGDESAENCLQLNFTGNSDPNAYSQLYQLSEDARLLAGKTITVSFYADTTSQITIAIRAIQHFGSGGTPSADVTVGPKTIVAGTAWSRYSVTFQMPTLAGQTLGTNGDHSTIIAFAVSSSTNNTATLGVGVQSGLLNLWNIVAEIGGVATATERRPFAIELALCLRYYRTGQVYQSGYSPIANGVVGGTRSTGPGPMRATPTVVVTTDFSSNVGYTAYGLQADAIFFSGNNMAVGNWVTNFTYTMSAEL